MQLTTIHTGFFKLDGGAMYGIVPKVLWNKLNPADENNKCTWAMRSLLIHTGERKILIDTGLGDKQDTKFQSHFEPHGNFSLFDSLQEAGYNAEDITDVFLTHLHFDHCGGAVKRLENGDLVPAFPNAVFWSNKAHWDFAMDPNPREKASFLKENFVPLQEAGKLGFIDFGGKERIEWLPGIEVQKVYGHTEAMMLLYIHTGDHTVVYCADLIPSASHIGAPYVMSYDLRPLITMQEKEQLLTEALSNNYLLYFEHDPTIKMCTVKRDERGRIRQNITTTDTKHI